MSIHVYFCTRGESLITEAYEIFVETIGFHRDFYENNRIPRESIRDFWWVIYPSFLYIFCSKDNLDMERRLSIYEGGVFEDIGLTGGYTKARRVHFLVIFAIIRMIKNREEIRFFKGKTLKWPNHFHIVYFEIHLYEWKRENKIWNSRKLTSRKLTRQEIKTRKLTRNSKIRVNFLYR